MNRLDQTLQSQFPTFLMPAHEPFTPLDDVGDRFLLGADRLKMEISRPWLHAVVDISLESFERTLPYGMTPKDSCQLRCAQVPKELLLKFMEMADREDGKEVGAWVVWDQHTHQFELMEMPVLHHSTSALEYSVTSLPEGNWLVVDMHSHGNFEPFFSETDNRDDFGSVKLSFVLGKREGEFQWVGRWSLLGVEKQIDMRTLSSELCAVYAQRKENNETPCRPMLGA